MPTVTMPQLGEGVEEGTIGKWLKKEGDHVAVGEPIVEVVTDKVNAEVPSPFEGTLSKILVAEGQTVPNDADLAEVMASRRRRQPPEPPRDRSRRSRARDPASRPPAADAPPAADPPRSRRRAGPPTARLRSRARPEPPRRPATGGQRCDRDASARDGRRRPASASGGQFTGRTTPAVRRLAREHGVDLATIAGTGIGRPRHARGRRARGQRTAARDRPRRDATAAPTAAAGATGRGAPPRLAPSPVAEGDSLKQLSPMRKAIAAHMTRSLEVPAAYITIEVDMTAGRAPSRARQARLPGARGHLALATSPS